jgi:hypothetical protein
LHRTIKLHSKLVLRQMGPYPNKTGICLPFYPGQLSQLDENEQLILVNELLIPINGLRIFKDEELISINLVFIPINEELRSINAELRRLNPKLISVNVKLIPVNLVFRPINADVRCLNALRSQVNEVAI